MGEMFQGKGQKVLDIGCGIKFKILKQEITFYKTFRLVGIKALANKFPRDYERFWTYIFPAENVTVLVEKEA